MLPVALPVPDPKRVRVTFISEVTGETLGFKDLCPRPGAVNGLNVWDNAAGNPAGWDTTAGACKTGTAPTPKSLASTTPSPGSKWERVGVIVHLSGSTDQIACGQPLVQCYQSGTSGLGFIHGWSDLPAVTDAANSAPRPRSVVLLPGTCGDAYFNTADHHVHDRGQRGGRLPAPRARRRGQRAQGLGRRQSDRRCGERQRRRHDERRRRPRTP